MAASLSRLAGALLPPALALVEHLPKPGGPTDGASRVPHRSCLPRAAPRALIQNLVNKPVLMENAAEMETKPEQELSAKQKALGEVGRTRISTLQFR